MPAWEKCRLSWSLCINSSLSPAAEGRESKKYSSWATMSSTVQVQPGEVSHAEMVPCRDTGKTAQRGYRSKGSCCMQVEGL